MKLAVPSDTTRCAPSLHLTSAQIEAIDQALMEVGKQGEVRLVIQRGHLRFVQIVEIQKQVEDRT
jgi:hypothetical protein